MNECVRLYYDLDELDSILVRNKDFSLLHNVQISSLSEIPFILETLLQDHYITYLLLAK
jgi:hypothetical protein